MRWIVLALACAAFILFLFGGSNEEDRANVPHDRADRVEQARPPAQPPVYVEPTTTVEKVGSPPIESGRCTLEIKLVNAETGTSIQSDVHLYRLDIPANSHWQAGDHLHSQFTVISAGSRIENLPAGLYRLDCGVQRVGGTADRAFEVRGELTRHIGHVQAARSDELWLHVTTPDGKSFGLQSIHWSRDRIWSWTRPAWTNTRVTAAGGSSSPTIRGGSRGPRRGTRYVGDRGPVHIGEVAEESRRRSRFRGPHTWHTKDHSSLSLPACEWRGEPIHLRGVSVPLDSILDAVLLPNGSRAVDHKARIVASSNAVEGDLEDALRVPIRVHASLAGYKDLTFEFTPGDPVPVHRMEPR